LFKDVIKEQLKIPANIDYLGELREFVTKVGKKHGFSDKIINAFKLAIDEAGTNVIRHAYRGSESEGFITIRALVKKNSLTVCLIDQGKYFDPKHVKDPDLQRYVDIGKKGGLGIFIMRKLMDDIDYRRTEEGNELRLTKNRDAPQARGGVKQISGKLHMRMPGAFKAIPATLKAKYWIRASAVITAIVGLAYLYFFVRASNEIRRENLEVLARAGNLIKNSLISDEEILSYSDGSKIQGVLDAAFKERVEFLHDIIIVDSLNYISAHSDLNLAFRQFDEMPAQRQAVAPDIYLYAITSGGSGKPAVREVYDYFTPIVTKSNLRYGHLHVRMFKDYIDSRIAERRAADGTLALMILLAGYVGTMLLVYVLINPFRKLADWVGTMGHGGDVSDQMDIDASTEVGEIAQAFSDITVKFRESQKNLAEQERLQKEMQVAQEIQQTLLPSDFPDLEGYELASHYEAAKEVGGDYYDFVEVDKDTLGVVVADVSGKGVPGSLVMTMIRTALRTEARNLYDAAEVLSRVNDFVMGDMKKGMFVTVFYVIIDSKRRRLNYASAGHNPMILYRPSTKKTYYLNPRGFPIGIQLHEKELFRKSIESDTIQLAEDDILLLYTDGITEAMNARRDLFGEERLLKCIREYGGLRVVPFVDKLKEEILSFTEGNVQYDDITAVAVREKTSPEKEELRRAREAHRLIIDGQSIREACEKVGITTYTYYNKYKREFEEKGIENFAIDAEESVDAKHIAIEDKTKIFDIIKNHPEYGAKRISEELNTEKYGFTIIAENQIYDELVRSRLNTRQLREAFVARGGRHRRPMKPPGTPMLTLDGKIILDRGKGFEQKQPPAEEVHEAPPPPRPAPAKMLPPPALPARPRVDLSGADIDANTLLMPIEDLLDRSQTELERDEKIFDERGESAPSRTEKAGTTSQAPASADRQEEAGVMADADEVVGANFSDLFADGAEVEVVGAEDEHPASTDREAVSEEDDSPEKVLLNIGQTQPAAKAERAADDGRTEKGDDDLAFSAVDDLLQQELENSFMATAGDDERDPRPAKRIPEEPSRTPTLEPDAKSDATIPFADEFANAVTSSEQELPLEFADGEDNWQQEHGFASAARRDGVMNNGMNKNGSDSKVLSYQESGADGVSPQGQAMHHPPPYASKDEEKRRDREEQDHRERLLVSGLRHYKSQRFQEAIDEFNKAIELYPDFKEAYSILGNAYFRNHMYAEAAQCYDRVKQMDARDTTAYENMGVIYANRGDFHEAVREWQELLKIDPRRDDIRKKIEKATRLMQSASV
jgi:serine phosphatase RsbU (regulator of sigma subunit)/anti-sigma regulatory factor (Ser/Thr protein kinase)/tetratricopeptide (TPR) repeat protein